MKKPVDGDLAYIQPLEFCIEIANKDWLLKTDLYYALDSYETYLNVHPNDDKEMYFIFETPESNLFYLTV